MTRVTLAIEHLDHSTVRLTNSRGDTFTYDPIKNQGLEDFINAGSGEAGQLGQKKKTHYIDTQKNKEVLTLSDVKNLPVIGNRVMIDDKVYTVDLVVHYHFSGDGSSRDYNEVRLGY